MGMIRVKLNMEASLTLSGKLLLKPGINDVDEDELQALMAPEAAALNRWFVEQGMIELVHPATPVIAPKLPELTPTKSYAQPDAERDEGHQEAVDALAKSISEMKAADAVSAVAKVDRLEVLIAISELDERATVQKALEMRAEQLQAEAPKPVDDADAMPPQGDAGAEG